MPIVIQEVSVDMLSSNADTPLPERGWVADEHLRELLTELHVAEERRKRLHCD